MKEINLLLHQGFQLIRFRLIGKHGKWIYREGFAEQVFPTNPI